MTTLMPPPSFIEPAARDQYIAWLTSLGIDWRALDADWGVAALVADDEQKMEWNEEDHPRGPDGRFISGGGDGSDGSDSSSGGDGASGGAAGGARLSYRECRTRVQRANFSDAAALRLRPANYADRWQDAPRVMTTKDAQQFLNTYHPATQFDLSGMSKIYATDVAHQVDKLWDKYPGAGSLVDSVSLGPRPYGVLMSTSGSFFAPERQIVMNDEVYSDKAAATELRDLVDSAAPDWFPKGVDAANVTWPITHEFGHVFDDWASHHGPTYAAWQELRRGVGAQDAELSGYGSRALNEGHNPGEQLADAFAAGQLGIASDNPLVITVSILVGQAVPTSVEGAPA